MVISRTVGSVAPSVCVYRSESLDLFQMSDLDRNSFTVTVFHLEFQQEPKSW